MKQRIGMVLAVVLVCIASMAAAAEAGRGDPMEVSRLLSQKLESMNLKPQALEKKENLILSLQEVILNEELSR